MPGIALVVGAMLFLFFLLAKGIEGNAFALFLFLLIVGGVAFMVAA